MSLEKVAGGRLTRAAIHAIETGKSRPSLATLRWIAERTAQPIGFFLSDEPAAGPDLALEMELRNRQARFAETLEMRPKAMAWAAGDPTRTALIHLHVGEALMRLTRPAEAVAELDLALPGLRAAGDDWRVATCLHLRSSSLYLQDDPEAQWAADEALAMARRLDPRVPLLEARILTHQANLAGDRRNWSRAEALFRAAIDAAEPIRNLRQLALAYEGLGMAYRRLGREVEADRCFNRALGLYELQDDVSNVAHTDLNLADMLTEKGKLEEAESHIDRAVASFQAADSDHRNRAFAMVLKARLRLEQGRIEEARQGAEEAIAIAHQRDQPQLAGLALQVLGRVAAVEGDPDLTDSCFERAISVWRDQGLIEPERLARIDYATALDGMSRPFDARAQWRAAALAGTPAAARAAQPAFEIQAN